MNDNEKIIEAWSRVPSFDWTGDVLSVRAIADLQRMYYQRGLEIMRLGVCQVVVFRKRALKDGLVMIVGRIGDSEICVDMYWS